MPSHQVAALVPLVAGGAIQAIHILREAVMAVVLVGVDPAVAAYAELIV